MPNLSVRFRGICCHIDPQNGESFVKRTVLRQARGANGHIHGEHQTEAAAPVEHLHHAVDHGAHHGVAAAAVVENTAASSDHIAYIECVADDVDLAASQGVTPSPVYHRPGDAGEYVRFTLDGDKVELVGVTAAPLTKLPSYDERIPKLKQVAPAFGPLAPQLLGDPSAMDPSFVAGVFDHPGGTLLAGLPEPFETGFRGETEWPTAKLASWVELLVEVPEQPRIRITPLAGGAPREIALKPGARLITIGNETENSILAIDENDPGSHFGVYYTLAAQPPVNPPQIEVFHGMTGGCSNSNYP
ncbi:MAG TPA: hypothetical protein VF618_11850 [Thermoanaerobaculia bacterium]